MSKELLKRALDGLEYLSKQANDGTKFFLIEDIKKELEEHKNTDKQFKPDWNNHKQGFDDGKAEAKEDVNLLHKKITDIKHAIIDCFSNQAIACDGLLSVRVRDYNKLVDVMNQGLEK